MKNHLAVQKYIQNKLPKGEIQLEVPFPSHVADVVWKKEKLIFEVQCSKMQIKEAKKRIEDYNKLGYTVVWILHDLTFNKRFVKPLERFLRNSCCYYTNITTSGHGFIYDQFELYEWNKRSILSPPLVINISKRTKKGFLNDRFSQKEDPTKKRKSFIKKLTTRYDEALFKFALGFCRGSD